MIKYDQKILWPEKSSYILASRGERLTSLLKWAGGKEQELKYILPLLPSSFDAYYEPFVGGGAVFFSMRSHKTFINDRSTDLFNFYLMVAQQDKGFFRTLYILLDGWQRISDMVDLHAHEFVRIYESYSSNEASLDEIQKNLNVLLEIHWKTFQDMFEFACNSDTENFIRELQRNLLSKTKRMKELEQKKWQLPEHDIVANIESALKSAFYMHLRHLHNRISIYAIPPHQAAAIFFFVRENAYASMFRYNSSGDFNVPYGGIAYNRKDLARKITYLQSDEIVKHFKNTMAIENEDFEVFLQKYAPQSKDFIFLDPPYDSEFSTYAQNEFRWEDQERLANYLLYQCKAKFMLVIKNTPAIFSLYNNKEFNIKAIITKKYLVSFQDRNNRDAEHLIITNY